MTRARIRDLGTLILCEITGRYLGDPGTYQVFSLFLPWGPAQGLLLDSSVYSLSFLPAQMIAVRDSFLQKGELESMQVLLPGREEVLSRVTQNSCSQRHACAKAMIVLSPVIHLSLTKGVIKHPLPARSSNNVN